MFTGRDKIRKPTAFKGNSFQDIAPYLTKDMLNTEARDVWYIFADPFWADFHIETKRRRHSSKRKAPQEIVSQDEEPPSVVNPFIDSLPLQAWIYMNEEPESGVSAAAKSDKAAGKKLIKALFNANGICNVQLNHYQYLFLLRMVEAFSELSLYLTYDLEQIIGQRVYDNLFTVLGSISNVEVSLLFPPLLPGKPESPSMDLDSSALPESSSGEIDDK